MILPQPTPENQALRREVADLTDRLAGLLAEREALTNGVGRGLEADYRLKLGALQLEVVTAECMVRRLRRKLELIQAALNHGEAPDPEAIELRLDEELAAWEARVDAAREALKQARRWVRLPTLSVDDARDLRTLYRRLAKRLHPDVNPGGGETAARLWLQAGAAYRMGDLGELRALALLADRMTRPELPVGNALIERRDALRAAVTRLLEEVTTIQQRFPFTLRDHLADPAWVAARQAELTARRDELADRQRLIEAALAGLLPGATDD